jgi:murein DD-endopeptidase MepM/ murein hydrolase activator NlpD
MHIILVRSNARSLTLRWNRRLGAGVALAGLALIGGFLGAGYEWARSGGSLSPAIVAHWRGRLAVEATTLRTLRRENRSEVDALAQRVAGLEARMSQLDALGAVLTQRAGISPKLFNFNAPVPEGGPSNRAREIPLSAHQLSGRIDRLADRIGAQRLALRSLNRRVAETRLRRQIIPEGHPVRSFWVSSPFGWRIDPITGRLEFHEGIDLAAPEGEPIHAVAAGVVTWAGPRYGFGNIVIVNDGQGYTTYYAHCERVFVKVGQVIRRGTVIALVGDTGMSTGPHVHFEVLRDDRPLNPAPFVFASRGG